jgi:hypothetical protein
VKRARPSKCIDHIHRLLALNLSGDPRDHLLDQKNDLEDFKVGASTLSAILSPALARLLQDRRSHIKQLFSLADHHHKSLHATEISLLNPTSKALLSLVLLLIVDVRFTPTPSISIRPESRSSLMLHICTVARSKLILSVCLAKSALNFATSSFLQTAHLTFIHPSLSLELDPVPARTGWYFLIFSQNPSIVRRHCAAALSQVSPRCPKPLNFVKNIERLSPAMSGDEMTTHCLNAITSIYTVSSTFTLVI